MKPWIKPFLILAALMFFIGADWQTEIAAMNIANNVPYGWPLCFLWPSNWAAFDFWRLIRYIIIAIYAYYGMENLINKIKQK